MACGFISGANAYVSGASSKEARKAGLIAGLTAGAFEWAGGVAPEGMDPKSVAAAASTERYIAHAIVGCVSTVAGDGNCGSGAAAALFGKWTSNNTRGLDIISRGIVTAVAGGVGAELTGGKFANGAMTAAFGYLFNQLASQDLPPSRGLQYGRIRSEFGLIEKLGSQLVPYMENGVQMVDENYRPIMSREDTWISRSGDRYVIRDHHLGHAGRFDAGPYLNVLRVSTTGQEFAIGHNKGHYFYQPTHPHINSMIRTGSQIRPTVKVLLERQMIMMRASGWQY